MPTLISDLWPEMTLLIRYQVGTSDGTVSLMAVSHLLIVAQVSVVMWGDCSLGNRSSPVTEQREQRVPLRTVAGVLAFARDAASKTTRLASAAVMSAWSYGGLTSTTSTPLPAAPRQILRTASSNSRADNPPGSGVPCRVHVLDRTHQCRLRETPRSRRWRS